MDKCVNCGKEVSDADRGSVGLLGNIGFLLMTKFMWRPSIVCGKCTRQVRAFGIVCVVAVVVIVIWATANSWR